MPRSNCPGRTRFVCSSLLSLGLAGCVASDGTSDGGPRDADPRDAGSVDVPVDTSGDVGHLDGATDAGSLAPHIEVSATTVDFAPFSVGIPVERTLTIRSVGTDDLRVQQVAIAVGASVEFEAFSPPVPVTLSPGESADVRVVYTARDAVFDNATLRITSSDRDAPIVEVALQAVLTGQSEIAVVRDPTTSAPEVFELDFGSTPTQGSRTIELYVKNVGSSPSILETTRVRTEPAMSAAFEFSTSESTPAFVDRFRPQALCQGGGPCPGDATCIDGVCEDASGVPLDTFVTAVTFTPPSTGAFDEVLVLENSDGDGDERTYRIRLVGVGVQAVLQVTPDPIDLGDLFVGVALRTPVALMNTGSFELEIPQVLLLDLVAPEFTLDAMVPVTVPPMDARSIAIVSEPTVAGAFAGRLRISSSDPTAPSTDVRVFGTARVAPEITTSSAAIDFGALHVYRAPSAGELAV